MTQVENLNQGDVAADMLMRNFNMNKGSSNAPVQESVVPQYDQRFAENRAELDRALFNSGAMDDSIRDFLIPEAPIEPINPPQEPQVNPTYEGANTQAQNGLSWADNLLAGNEPTTTPNVVQEQAPVEPQRNMVAEHVNRVNREVAFLASTNGQDVPSVVAMVNQLTPEDLYKAAASKLQGQQQVKQQSISELGAKWRAMSANKPTPAPPVNRNTPYSLNDVPSGRGNFTEAGYNVQDASLSPIDSLIGPNGELNF